MLAERRHCRLPAAQLAQRKNRIVTTDDNPNDPNNEDRDTADKRRTGTGLFAVIGSVLSAAFGVQSSRNRQRDFERGRPVHFIVGGLIGTILFIAIVLFAVQAVLPD